MPNRKPTTPEQRARWRANTRRYQARGVRLGFVLMDATACDALRRLVAVHGSKPAAVAHALRVADAVSLPDAWPEVSDDE